MRKTMLLMPQFWLLTGFTVLLVFMVAQPSAAVNAAGAGLRLWAMIVVPALLPFFIVSELLVSMGVVRFLGVLLEPVMQPIFRLPGCSSLVVAMGFTSGFPIGAILTRRLFEEGLLNGDEAERLAAFTNNSSPLFILGAVGMGMFGSARLGWLLAISHYSANLAVGVLGRFKAPAANSAVKISGGRWQAANTELSASLDKDYFARRLADAIAKSIANILAIGGYILIFSVITTMLSDWGLMELITRLIQGLFTAGGLSYQVAYGAGMGLFEITLGCNTIAHASDAPLLQQLAAVSAVLALSGLCVITQVMGVMVGTPMRLGFYLKARLWQALIAVSITLIGYGWAFASAPAAHTFLLPSPLYTIHAWRWSWYCLSAAAIIIMLMLAAALVIRRD